MPTPAFTSVAASSTAVSLPVFTTAVPALPSKTRGVLAIALCFAASEDIQEQRQGNG
jgi:hypothetical protein